MKILIVRHGETDGNAARVLQLCDVAHGECFIANSLACPVTVEAAVRVADN